MNRRVIKTADAYKVEIFIGGDFDKASEICADYCNRIGLCVTIEPTTYIYRCGGCEGVRIGLINYARFPASNTGIWNIAYALAELLKDGLNQGSFTIQDHERSMFVSDRDEDQ